MKSLYNNDLVSVEYPIINSEKSLEDYGTISFIKFAHRLAYTLKFRKQAASLVVLSPKSCQNASDVQTCVLNALGYPDIQCKYLTFEGLGYIERCIPHGTVNLWVQTYSLIDDCMDCMNLEHLSSFGRCMREKTVYSLGINWEAVPYWYSMPSSEKLKDMLKRPN